MNVAIAEAVNFASPLRLQRRRADDEDFLDAGLARQQFRDADALNRFAESHVVGQDRSARADGERNAIELVRQQFRLEQ